MKRTQYRGLLAPGRAGRRLDPKSEPARSPFERFCLLKWSFLDQAQAVSRARPYERPVRCRWCGNWHLEAKK
jgi:hypothetical protein